jgi:hypothetical protein
VIYEKRRTRPRTGPAAGTALGGSAPAIMRTFDSAPWLRTSPTREPIALVSATDAGATSASLAPQSP